MAEKKTINYIEPNLIYKITDDNGNVFEQTPNLEDYCITVNLGVTLFNRKSGVKSIEGLTKTRYLLSWNGYEGSVNFMRGSQLFFDETKTDHINSLTTDYADFYYDDLVNNSDKLATTEMFGIESIDINYDNYYVPQVTVKFIDIRGISLFMPEELRHNISSNDIDGSINHDIAGSFFKSFFMFPYPKFDMMVKGFYGKPITFELNIVDWRATFDCSKGSFGCTVNFIGYSYALLSDITLNALLAAPESDYIGKSYWNNQVSNGVFVYDDGTPMKTFREMIHGYLNYVNEKEKLEATNPKSVEMQTLSAQNELLTNITNYFNGFTDALISTQKKAISQVIIDETDYSFAYCVENQTIKNTFLLQNIKEKAISLNSSITQYNSRFKGDGIPQIDLNIFINELEQGTSINNTLSSTLTNKNFAKKIIAKSQTTTENVYKYAYIFDSKEFALKLKQKKDKINQDMSFISSSLSEEYQKLTQSVLGFDNSLANIMKMLCAHLDTLVTMIYSCADKANNDTNRTLDKFINLASQDVIFTNEQDKYMPAFPQVGVKNVVNGVDKIEMGWIEDVYPQAEEVNLVKGLINGSEIIAKQVTEATEYINLNTNSTSTQAATPSLKYIPSLPFDFINRNNPFGSDNISWNLLDDVFARIYMRGFIASYTFPIERKLNESLNAIASIDAYNFHAMNPTPSANFVDLVLNTKKFDDFINYKNYESSSYAWGRLPLLTQNYSVLSLQNNLFYNDNALILPIRNFDYKSQIKSASLNKSDYKNNIIYKSDVQINNDTNPYHLSIIKHNADIQYSSWFESYPSDDKVKGSSKLKDIYMIDEMDNTEFNDKFDISEVKEKAQKLYTNDKWLFVTTNPSSVFGDYRYYALGDELEKKAYFFLNALYANKDEECIKFLAQNEKCLYALPYLLLIYVGARLKYGDDIYVKYISKFAKNLLIQEFEKWVNDDMNGFTRISRELELDESDIQQFKTVKNKTLIKSSSKRLSVYYPTPYGDITLGDEFQVKLKIKDDADVLNVLIEEMTERTLLVKSIKYNNSMVTNQKVTTSNLKQYLNGFFSTLKSIYSQKKENNELTTSQVNDPQTNKHLYISLYNYLKLTYDRWLGGKNDDERAIWLLNSFYQRFHFIDSFYFKIGNEIHLDIEHMVKLIDGSLRQDTMSLVEFINTILAHQNMLFLSIQNFLDLSKKENIEDMFKPIPYNEIGNVQPQTDFICLYTYKPSNNLNIEGSEYQDDSFLLSDPNIGETMPFLVVNDKDTGYDIPCFGVTYGKQYQSYFTNISPTMENPVITEQVIKSQFLLANSAPNGSSKELFVGQDLYTIYSNNSYSCTVEMLGCAWVQPLMYFALLNIPMFRGSYLIHKVSHSIQQGMMKTTFVGTRMCKICTPLILDKLITLRNNENGAFQPPKVINNNQASNDNNCPYPKFEPLTNSLDGYISAIQESCKATVSINDEMQIQTVNDSLSAFIITYNDRTKLSIVFDMILYTYYARVKKLFWVINNDNEYKCSPIEVYVEINTNDTCTVKRQVAIVKKGYLNNIVNISHENVSDDFIKSLAKVYNDERQFITDCYNFKKYKNTYKEIKSLYNFDCSVMNISNDDISNIQKLRNMGQPNVIGLPNQIKFPISGLEGCNISGYFGEYREKSKPHYHMGLDIGVGGSNRNYKMLSIYDGVIISAEPNPDTYGQIIVIRHSIRDANGLYLHTRYLHGFIKDNTIKKGKVVISGEEIGTVSGLRGYAHHLHLEFSFFNGDYSYEKFKKNAVDPQSFYYFGIYHKAVSSSDVVDSQGNIRKMGTANTPSYLEVHPK